MCRHLRSLSCIYTNCVFLTFFRVARSIIIIIYLLLLWFWWHFMRLNSSPYFCIACAIFVFIVAKLETYQKNVAQRCAPLRVDLSWHIYQHTGKKRARVNDYNVFEKKKLRVTVAANSKFAHRWPTVVCHSFFFFVVLFELRFSSNG